MLLKNYAGKPIDAETLEVWDEQLAETGMQIRRKREAFLEEFHAIFQQYYDAISLGREQVELVYKSSVGDENLLVALRESLEKDRIMTYTTVGIHRDDLMLNIGGYPVKKTGSQGQKKTFLTALKLAQYVWLYNQNKIKPLLLLDDIFDKLDADRVRQIVKIVGGELFGQIFITDTNRGHIDEILQIQGEDYRLFHIEQGEIIES